MRPFFIYPFLMFLLVFSSCKTQNNVQTQGITGKVTFLDGNQMPPSSSEGVPAIRTILVFELTKMSDTEGQAPLFDSVNTKLIAKTSSNKQGDFKIKLPVGQYSIFIQENDKYFANSFNSQNMIHLVDVQENTWSQVEININYSASF